MTVVITGASGFLASHLIAALLAKGRDVVALTRDARKLAPRPSLRIVETDYASLALPPSSTLVHLAAVRNMPSNRARNMQRVNVELAMHIARAAVQQRVAKFVHVATALALGSSRVPLDAAAPLTDFADPYVRSRVDGIRALEAIDGLPLVTLLPSIVYGPDHPHARNRITSHIRRLLARRWRVAVGGEPRNLVYVDDVVRAIESAPERGRHLVAGENATQDELERAVFAAAGRAPTPRIVVPRVLARCIPLRRMKTLLAPWCFVPTPTHTSLRDGIAATVRSL